jgi:diguanylate cyclase (GGDEF)-like protein
MREGTPLGLLMVDVDLFKAYNDTYGHPIGDLCLHQIADALRSALRRPADVLARYGGEEFTILLPNTPLPGAVAVGDAMRQRLNDLALTHAGSPTGTVTISVGAAVATPSAAIDPDLLLQAADRALYAAKRAGRNQLRQAEDIGTSAVQPRAAERSCASEFDSVAELLQQRSGNGPRSDA